MPVPAARADTCVAPTDGLVGWWKFDDGGGTTAADSSGNGLTATLYNSPVWTAGKIGDAVNFLGGSDYVSVPDSPSLGGMSALTVSAWAYLTNGTAQQVIASKRHSGSPYYSYILSVANNNPSFGVVNSSSAEATASDNTASVPNNQWFFLVGVYDGSQVYIYLNGSLIGWQSALTGTVFDSNGNLNFGVGATPGTSLDGKVDDVRIYNRALSATEIQQLYNAHYAGDIIYNAAYGVEQYCNGGNWVSMGPVGNTTTGLVGWWKMDETSGTSAADSSGNNNTGTLTGGPTWTAGMDGGALGFSQSSYQYVDVGNSSYLNFERNQPFSLAAWVNYTDTSANGYFPLITKQVNAGNFPGYLIDANMPNNKINVSLQGTSATGNQILVMSPSGSFTPDVWHHVVMTYDGSSTAAGVHVYIDGVDQTLTVQYDALSSSILNSADMTIGDAPATGEHTGAIIDDARVYNRALSADDVMALYTSTGGGSGDINSNLIGYWKMDETSGTSVADSSGSGNAGTLTPNATGVWVAGKINDGAKLNGTTQYVSIPDAASLRLSGSWSISEWVKLSALPGASSVEELFTKQASAGGTVNYTLSVDNNGNCTTDPTFGVAFTNTSGTAAVACYNVVVATGTWYHVTGVWDSSATTLSLYVNGISVASTTTALVPDSSAGYPLTIGEVFGAYFLNGTVDDVRLYNRALSPADVLTLYNSEKSACASPVGHTGDTMYNSTSHVPAFCDGTNWIPMGPVPRSASGSGCNSPAGSEGDFTFNSTVHALEYCDGLKWVAAGGGLPTAPTNGLVGWWKLDDGSSGTTPTAAVDSSGQGNTGTTQNSPVWTSSGEIGNALTFNGSNQYVSAADTNVANNAAFTVAAWFKTSSTASKLKVLTEGYPAQGQGNYISVNENVTGDVEFGVCAGSGCSTWGGIATGNINLNDGNWHQVVGVQYSKSSRSLYVDGVLKATDSTTIGTVTTTEFLIGTNLSTYFNGAIDDVRVYNRALSAEEIWDLYLGTGGT